MTSLATKYLSEPTVDRLIHVAIEVFAENGFRATTVREICTRAKVNVASVNYYFRSKEALYLKALTLAIQEANERYPTPIDGNSKLKPEERLTLFIINFMHKILDDTYLGYNSQLITREISEPTKALDEIIEIGIMPQLEFLDEIVQQILGSDADKKIVKHCLMSIIGQCLVFKHSRSIVDRLYPELIANETAIQDTAMHIAKFSIIALVELAQQGRSDAL